MPLADVTEAGDASDLAGQQKGGDDLDKNIQREVKYKLQNIINYTGGISDQEIANTIKQEALDINNILRLPDFSELGD